MVVRVKRHDETLMFLVRFLLFKLMFMSGVVKLQSQCPTWLVGRYHFQLISEGVVLESDF